MRQDDVEKLGFTSLLTEVSLVGDSDSLVSNDWTTLQVPTVEKHSRLLFEHLSSVCDARPALVYAVVAVSYLGDVQTNAVRVKLLRVHPAIIQRPPFINTINPSVAVSL